MPFLLLIIQVLFVLLAPYLQLILGYSLLRFLLKRTGVAAEQEPEIALPAAFVFGLLFYLFVVFIFASFGAYWGVSAIVPLLFLLVPALDSVRVQTMVHERLPRLTLHFGVWFVAVFALGASLLGAGQELRTPWVNNYGDCAFHLGMISSFVFGGNMPPEYHIFPGERLSYPFLMNLWTAVMWALYPAGSTLPFVFAAQWTVIWTLAYSLVNGDRNRLLPWALLFGGGSWDYVFRHFLAQPGSELAAKQAHAFIGEGYPWTPFLTTIWVTQRPALLGLIVLLCAVSLLHRALDKINSGRPEAADLLTPGVILALAPLTHTHLFLVAVLYAGILIWCVLGPRAFFPGSFAGEGNAGTVRMKAIRLLAHFHLPLLCAVVFLPWLIGKSKIMTVVPGWYPDLHRHEFDFFVSLLHTTGMWLNNAPVWMLLLAIMLFRKSIRLQAAAVCIIFAAGNFIHFAVWEWDQMKVFLALYAITLSLVPFIERRFAALLVLALLGPGVYETARMFASYQDFVVYSADDLDRAREIRRYTERGAVILAAPDHNSPVTISGRSLFTGYEGTTNSHSLPYEPRKRITGKPEDIAACWTDPAFAAQRERICPRYLLWSIHEQNHWKQQTPGRPELFIPYRAPYLYRIKPPA